MMKYENLKWEASIMFNGEILETFRARKKMETTTLVQLWSVFWIYYNANKQN